MNFQLKIFVTKGIVFYTFDVCPAINMVSFAIFKQKCRRRCMHDSYIFTSQIVSITKMNLCVSVFVVDFEYITIYEDSNRNIKRSVYCQYG